MATFDQFQQEWLTVPPRRVADPLLAGDHPYQCVSLVKQGLAEIDGLSMTNSWWGNAIDYWTKTNPAILSTRIAVPTQDVQRGDVVVLRTNGTNPGDFSGYGHIGWATGQQNATQFELLEQNGATGNGLGDGGDAIRTRWIPKSRIAGVLRGKLVAPYTIRPVDPYKRDVLEGHQKWNLDQPNFAAVAASPILTLNQRTTITVAAELHHHAIPQYTYLLEDPNVPQGYNQLDTEAYVPAPPPYKPPEGKLPFPAAEQYELVTDVPTYQTPTNAQNKRPADGERLPPGTYYVYANDSGMKQLTLVNGKPSGLWINPLENELSEAHPPLPTPVAVPAVEPEPVIGSEANQSWKQYYRAFPSKELYLALHDYEVADIGGSRPGIPLPKYDPSISQSAGRAYVYGTFPGPDGVRYYRLKDPQDVTFSAFYGVPILDHDGLPILVKQPAVKPALPAPVKQKASNKDTIHLITAHIEAGIPKFIDILPKWYKQIKK